MTPKNRSLLMRSNRLLGAQLVEQNLVPIEDLEVANEKLLELIGTGTNRQRTVLGILAYELNVLKEEQVLRFQAENHGTGFTDLRHYEINEGLKAAWDAEESWATWTVPFDVQEDITFLASAYYLSPGVRKYWETRYDGKVLWYGTTLEGIADLLESLDEETAESDSTAS